MNEALVKAADVKVGHRLYDNRPHNWLDRWPVVTKIEPISAGRLALTTRQRLFVALPDELLLSKE